MALSKMYKRSGPVNGRFNQQLGALCVFRLDYKAIHPEVIFSICTHPFNHFVLGHGHFTHRTLAKKCKMQLELYKYNLTSAFQSKLIYFSTKN
jgi:hypothetical protein